MHVSRQQGVAPERLLANHSFSLSEKFALFPFLHLCFLVFALC